MRTSQVLRQKRNSNFKQNRIVILNLLSTLILQGMAFFTEPIFSGILGAHNYGIVSVYVTWVQIASTVLTLQAAETIALARVHFPMEEQLQYQSSVLSLAVVLYLIFSSVILAVTFALRNLLEYNILMIAVGLAHGLGMYCVSFANSKFSYEFKAEYNLVLSLCTSICNITLSFLFICRFPAGYNYWGRILGQSVTYSLIGGGVYFLMIHVGKTFYKRKYWSYTLPIAIPTVFHLLANLLLQQSDRLMLQRMVDNSAVGIYTLAATFGTIINVLWLAFNNSWAPLYFEYMRTASRNEMIERAKNYMELFVILTCGFILLSREVFHIFAGRNYWGGTKLIPFFALGYYMVFLYSFCVNFEFFYKKTRVIAIATTIASLCNIMLNYFMIKWIGIMGAVVATATAHGIQFAFHYIIAQYYIKEEFPFQVVFFLPGLLIVLFCSCLYFVLADVWIIRWGIGAIMGVYLLHKMIKRRSIF